MEESPAEAAAEGAQEQHPSGVRHRLTAAVSGPRRSALLSALLAMARMHKVERHFLTCGWWWQSSPLTRTVRAACRLWPASFPLFLNRA